MIRVFMSYRRDDSAADALLIHERLKKDFDSDLVFFDIDTLRPGAEFVSEILEAVSQCDVLIAVIGKHWVDIRDDAGNLRLQNPKDVLRREIATALEKGKWVIPVLVGGANFPKEEDLPDDLKPIRQRNALSINYTTFGHDIEKLIDTLKQILVTDAKSVSDNLSKSASMNQILMTSVEDLAQFFSFTYEELELNRTGNISSAQKLRLAKYRKEVIKLTVQLLLLDVLLWLPTRFIDWYVVTLLGGLGIISGFFALIVSLLAFSQLLNIFPLFFKPQIKTEVGVLHYRKDGRSLYIGSRLLTVANPIYLTPKSPSAGLIYYAYHISSVLLSIEPGIVL